jgi:hypothetical protein
MQQCRNDTDSGKKQKTTETSLIAILFTINLTPTGIWDRTLASAARGRRITSFENWRLSKTVPTSQRTQGASITKNSPLIPCKEITGICCNNRTEMQRCFNVTSGGTYCYHWVLNGYVILHVGLSFLRYLSISYLISLKSLTIGLHLNTVSNAIWTRTLNTTYRVIKKSLCTWWLQYKKNAKIF